MGWRGTSDATTPLSAKFLARRNNLEAAVEAERARVAEHVKAHTTYNKIGVTLSNDNIEKAKFNLSAQCKLQGYQTFVDPKRQGRPGIRVAADGDTAVYMCKFLR